MDHLGSRLSRRRSTLPLGTILLAPTRGPKGKLGTNGEPLVSGREQDARFDLRKQRSGAKMIRCGPSLVGTCRQPHDLSFLKCVEGTCWPPNKGWSLVLSQPWFGTLRAAKRATTWGCSSTDFSGLYFTIVLRATHPNLWRIPYLIIEGSLEVKLPTIWTDEKQSRAEAERRGRLEERRWEEKE